MMSALNPTPRRVLVDGKGRPYFLWDMDMTLDEFEGALRTLDPQIRGYLIAKLMRQAKPDDVFSFVTIAEIRAVWPFVESRLGQKKRFWHWLLGQWGVTRDGHR
jgi:hypothetical protein